MALCPECDADIDVSEFDVDEGDVVSCADCGANLVVVSLSPFELDVAPDEDDAEDSDDDDDFDDVEDDEDATEDDEAEEKTDDDEWDH
jgi:alpha-aminoadipate carrier protein LysW